MPGIGDIIGKALGESGKSIFDGVADLLSKIIPDPTAKAQAITDLKKLEVQHETDMANLALEVQKEADDIYKSQLLDIQNARTTNVSIQESTEAGWLAKNVGYMLDIFIAVIWGGLTLYLIARILHIISATKDAPDMTAVMGIYTGVTSIFMIVVNFHRGSTANSRVKDDTINTMAKTS